MAYGTPSDPVSGTVITVAYAKSNILDPIRWLRLLTGNADPPGSSYVIVSSSTSGAAWQKVPTDAIADGAVTAIKLATGAALGNLGYTPLNKAGDTASGTLNVTKTQGIVSTAFATAQFVAQSLDANVNPAESAGVGFHRLNASGLYLYHDGTWLKMLTNTGVTAVLWHDQNDGAGSGLDADLLDAHDTPYFLSRANHSGTQLAATISDLATAVGGMAAASAASATNATNATNATTAGNASQLGGVAASGYARFASGSYAGNGAASRQITTGFLCKHVTIATVTGVPAVWHVVSATVANNFVLSGTTTVHGSPMSVSTALHASDGFVTDGTGSDGSNNAGTTYFWAAWG